MMIFMNSKVRSRMPDVPSVEAPEPEPVKRGRGRPPGVLAEEKPVKLIREEVAGVRLDSFKNIPAELLNRIVGRLGDMFAKLLKILEATYRDGVDQRLPDLVEHVVPELVYEFGRAATMEVLAQQRGFLGSHLQCHHEGCEQSLDYEGDVEKEVKTKLGPIQVKRAYYHGKCGHSVCPLDILLGLDGKHSALPSFQEAIGLLGATLSYPEAVRLIDTLLPCKVSLRGVETITSTIAEDVQKRQKEELANVMADPGKATLGAITEGVAVLSADGGFIKARDGRNPILVQNFQLMHDLIELISR